MSTRLLSVAIRISQYENARAWAATFFLGGGRGARNEEHAFVRNNAIKSCRKVNGGYLVRKRVKGSIPG